MRDGRRRNFYAYVFGFCSFMYACRSRPDRRLYERLSHENPTFSFCEYVFFLPLFYGPCTCLPAIFPANVLKTRRFLATCSRSELSFRMFITAIPTAVHDTASDVRRVTFVSRVINTLRREKRRGKFVFARPFTTSHERYDIFRRDSSSVRRPPKMSRGNTRVRSKKIFRIRVGGERGRTDTSRHRVPGCRRS